MNQEQSFKKYYKGLTPSEVSDEINTLANIKLCVDFYEYITTDPEKLLSIIHFNNLEETYGIRVVFDNDDCSHTSDCNNCHLSDRTGNMSIIFRFNNDTYRISTMIDSVTNNTIYDSFVEQVLFLINNHRADIVSREEAELKKVEKDIMIKYNAAVNVMWYVLNSPKNIEELLEYIHHLPEKFVECREDPSDQWEDPSDQRKDISNQQDTSNKNHVVQERIDKCNSYCEQACPAITVVVCVLLGVFIRLMELSSHM